MIFCPPSPEPQNCTFGRSCELPCDFQSGSDKILHWQKKNQYEGNVQNVLSYDNKMELDPLYMGRASLFQINEPNGDASLRLKPVSIQDEGTYTCFCFTSTTWKMEHMNINLRVIGEIK